MLLACHIPIEDLTNYIQLDKEIRILFRKVAHYYALEKVFLFFSKTNF